MEDMNVRETCVIEVKNLSDLLRGTSWWTSFYFLVLINFQLSAKHFSMLPRYFMKWEDRLEKLWILKLAFNFGGIPSDTASTFPKMASADWYFLYEDDLDAVITISDC